MKTENVVLLCLMGAALFIGYLFVQNHMNPPAPPTDSHSKRPLVKRILLVFTSNTCKPCQRFKKDADNNRELSAALSAYDVKYIPVGNKEWGFDVTSYPTFIVVEPDWKKTVVKRTEGYESPTKFVKWLNGGF